jgi:two-component system response regulator MtrA
VSRHETDLPRSLTSEAPPVYEDDRMRIDPEALLVEIDGEALLLSPSQLGLLVELLRHREAVRTREQLIDAMWGPRAPVDRRAIDSLVMKLRARLRARVPEISYIQTHQGFGYRFHPRPSR